MSDLLKVKAMLLIHYFFKRGIRALIASQISSTKSFIFVNITKPSRLRLQPLDQLEDSAAFLNTSQTAAVIYARHLDSVGEWPPSKHA
jgi:hypothetical protein